ncbi:hypothetical protein [Nocardia nepalensis]|uniref:hypothetical protein n=1 Tax=Nocardia nepalensis TaxID=3375448 RepID=UPI003B679A68
MNRWRELDPQWRGRMENLEVDLPKWMDWIGQPNSPALGSQLFDDDKLCSKWSVSQMAWQSLMSATDHLDMLSDSITHSGVRPIAQFTLARAALFAGARAVWILGSDEQKVRQKHALWVAYEDFRYLRYDCEKLMSSSLGKKHTPETKAAYLAEAQALVDEVKEIARDKLEFRVGRGKDCEKIPDDTDIVDYAARYTDPEDLGSGAALNHQWRVNSGYAHGLGWPQLLAPAEVIETEDGKRFRRVVGDDESLAQGLAGAWLLTQRGFRLYWQRSTATTLLTS